MNMGWLAASALALIIAQASPHHAASSLGSQGQALAGQRVRAAAPLLERIVAPGGQPDDLAVDAHGRLIWGDLARGTVQAFDGRRVVTLASGLSAPEGIVPLPDGTLIVAEQGRDRLVRVDARGRLSVLYRLVPVAGQEGVDGIARDPRTGDLIVPDSPHGTVLRLSADGRRATVIARGLGRPAGAAVDRHGTILIADENLHAVFSLSPGGHLTRLATLPTPDDVSVDGAGRIWVTTLGDNGLWVIEAGRAPRQVLSGLADPQGLALDRCGNPLIVQSGTARIDRLVLHTGAAC